MKKILTLFLRRNFAGGVIAITAIAFNSQAQGTWIQKSSIAGSGRFGAFGFSIGNKGYIGAGYGCNDYLGDFWQYDPMNNTWTQKANFGGGTRYGAVGLAIGNKGYAGLGVSDGTPYLSDFWEYDPVTNSWTQKANYGGAGKEHARGFSLNGKGYVGTGYVDTKEFWQYDPGADTWVQKADFGGPATSSAVAFAIGTKGYLGTGDFLIKDFWEYDAVTNSWTQKADFGGTGRYACAGFSIGTKGYIGTGTDLGGNKNDFWEYDPTTNAWAQRTSFAGTARYIATGFSVGAKGYIGTGSDITGTCQNDLWEYSPDYTHSLSTSSLLSNILQPDDAVSIGYTASGAFNAGNIFTVQLSDETGDFESPTIIGSLTTTVSGSINATIPFTTPYGTEYRLRVVSSNPFVYGSDKGQNITIGEDHTITVGAISGSPFCPEAEVNISFTSTGTFASGNVYTAQLSNKSGSFSAPTSIGTLVSTANAGIIPSVIPSKPDAGKNYHIRVLSSYQSVEGVNYSKLELIACKKVTGLSASGINSTSATISWSNLSCVAKYKVQYRKQGTSSWTTKYSTVNSYTITGLLPNTKYEYRVQTYCSESGSSKAAFTAIQTFTTTLRMESDLASPVQIFSIYPNPAKEETNIYFTLRQSSHVNVKLYDANGKQLRILMNDDLQPGDYSIQLSTAEFAKGVYLVKMISDEGIENQKLIVQ